MKLTYLQSASVMIEHEGVKVLCDPWFEDGILYGSWAHYPPFKFEPRNFDDIDFIYISHVHQDHLDEKTLSQLRKDIPVLIHDFPEKYLKNNIERLGFKVRELPHNKRINLKKDLYINILAADNCDPKICGKLFACDFNPNHFGTNQIDTLCVIDNEKEVIVNMNDCPFEIAFVAAQTIKNIYKKVDLLLVGYAGASSYPGCYELDEKEIEANKKKQLRMDDAKRYIELFEPKYYLPFAGRFTLRGKLISRMMHSGEPELDEAYDYLNLKIDQTKYKGIILNPYSWFDISTGLQSEQYNRVNPHEKSEYIRDVLSKSTLDYENGECPTTEQIVQLISPAYERFERHRKNSGFSSETKILIDLDAANDLMISCEGKGYEIVSKTKKQFIKKYIRLSLDKVLLYWILQGPRKAHWNNADAGYHILWERIPNIYERGIYYCLNFFHS